MVIFRRNLSLAEIFMEKILCFIVENNFFRIFAV